MSVGWLYKTKMSDLHCIECNTVFTIPRKKGKLREKNHIKDMYCFKCKKDSKFIENITESHTTYSIKF